MSKVAVITGGASGIGLYVATGLSQRQSEKWLVHIVDFNAAQGERAAADINATFHSCDVTKYGPLSLTFQNIYRQHHRLDFVYANAGIAEKNSFFDGAPSSAQNSDEPPPPPELNVLDVNLTAAIATSWLALHYFRLSRAAQDDGWEGNIVMTSSVAGVYGAYPFPIYSASKYGVVGFVRSVSRQAYQDQKVRVNCICPGLVRTGMTAEMNLPDAFITPPENIVRAILMLIDGKGSTDTAGVKVETGKVFGRAVEVAQDTWYWVQKPRYTNELMAALCGDTWEG